MTNLSAGMRLRLLELAVTQARDVAMSTPEARHPGHAGIVVAADAFERYVLRGGGGDKPARNAPPELFDNLDGGGE